MGRRLVAFLLDNGLDAGATFCDELEPELLTSFYYWLRARLGQTRANLETARTYTRCLRVFLYTADDKGWLQPEVAEAKIFGMAKGNRRKSTKRLVNAVAEQPARPDGRRPRGGLVAGFRELTQQAKQEGRVLTIDEVLDFRLWRQPKTSHAEG